MVEKFPAAAKNNAAYIAFTLLWTEVSMAYPASVTANGIMTNIYRILSQSENVAMIILMPNETTQGGTEYN